MRSCAATRPTAHWPVHPTRQHRSACPQATPAPPTHARAACPSRLSAPCHSATRPRDLSAPLAPLPSWVRRTAPCRRRACRRPCRFSLYSAASESAGQKQIRSGRGTRAPRRGLRIRALTLGGGGGGCGGGCHPRAAAFQRRRSRPAGAQFTFHTTPEHLYREQQQQLRLLLPPLPLVWQRLAGSRSALAATNGRRSALRRASGEGGEGGAARARGMRCGWRRCRSWHGSVGR